MLVRLCLFECSFVFEIVFAFEFVPAVAFTHTFTGTCPCTSYLHLHMSLRRGESTQQSVLSKIEVDLSCTE